MPLKHQPVYFMCNASDVTVFKGVRLTNSHTALDDAISMWGQPEDRFQIEAMDR
ncbi:MAG: hypothetical protein VXZ96_05800 [Myxococcota bacterium]|nr:hypothetical protein [Myxococcota bacterium]